MSERLALIVAVILIAGCGRDASPGATTEPPPRWCPQTADDGQRYYVACDD
jgi:hypothetical protein